MLVLITRVQPVIFHPWIMRFSTLTDGNNTVLRPEYVLGTVIFGWGFFVLGEFSHMHTPIILHWVLIGRQSHTFSSVLLSPLLNTVLWHPGALVSPDSQLPHIHSGRQRVSARVPSPCAAAWELCPSGRPGCLSGSSPLLVVSQRALALIDGCSG